MTAEESSDEKMPPNEAETAASAAKMDPETEPLHAAADPKVKFIGGSETVDVEKGGSGDEDHGIKPALTKSELMKYASDPFWVKLRWILFVLFWVGWLAMLVASIVIIVFAPKCPSPPPKEWWQKRPIYEVYVKSFKDSNGDGQGDLNGVKSEAEYLDNLGVGSVWLSSIYKSPMKDNGYDVSDYKVVDPSFGSMEDFEALVEEMHGRDIKVIMDFIPNHSSEEHEWFQKSVKKEEPYTDYYVWADGKNGGPPNNWRSVFGGSAWTLNAERGQYYLHQFYKEQPDLNLRNEKVVAELTDIMKFWLDKGVDGFRVDSVGNFFENEDNSDENSNNNGDGYTGLDHDKTFDLAEVLDLLKKFRKVLDDATEDDGAPKIMMTEAYLSADKLTRYYGDVSNQIGDIAHMPLNFNLLRDFKEDSSFTAAALNKSISSYLSQLPDEAWPNFCLGNHDHPRVSSKFGAENVDAMNILLMMLPGTPFTYYGEEIGMVDGSASEREAYRTPMQWNTESHSGFSSGTPWLAVNTDYNDINVASEKAKENGHVKIYEEMSELRESETLLFGNTDMKVEGDVFVLSRVKKGNPGFVLISNFGSEESKIDIAELPNMSDRGTLSLASPMSEGQGIGTTIDTAEITVEAHQSLLLTFVPKF